MAFSSESGAVAGIYGAVGRGSLGFAGIRNTALELWAYQNDQRLIAQSRENADQARWDPSLLDDGTAEAGQPWTEQRAEAADLSGAALMAQLAEADALMASMAPLL